MALLFNFLLPYYRSIEKFGQILYYRNTGSLIVKLTAAENKMADLRHS